MLTEKQIIKKYKGGLSLEVIKSRVVQRYCMSDNPCGYIGSSSRTKWHDKVIEVKLREEGLGSEGIGVWLTSTSGRHLMDNPEKRKFEDRVGDYCKNAFVEVTIWSHPDHTGMLSSSEILRKKIKQAFTKVTIW